MGLKAYNENDIQNIANSIRNKGVSGNFTVAQMASNIDNITTGGNYGALNVVANGVYNNPAPYDAWNEVNVQVPSPEIPDFALGPYYYEDDIWYRSAGAFTTLRYAAREMIHMGNSAIEYNGNLRLLGTPNISRYGSTFFLDGNKSFNEIFGLMNVICTPCLFNGNQNNAPWAHFNLMNCSFLNRDSYSVVYNYNDSGHTHPMYEFGPPNPFDLGDITISNVTRLSFGGLPINANNLILRPYTFGIVNVVWSNLLNVAYLFEGCKNSLNNNSVDRRIDSIYISTFYGWCGTEVLLTNSRVEVNNIVLDSYGNGTAMSYSWHGIDNIKINTQNGLRVLVKTMKGGATYADSLFTNFTSFNAYLDNGTSPTTITLGSAEANYGLTINIGGYVTSSQKIKFNNTYNIQIGYYKDSVG